MSQYNIYEVIAAAGLLIIFFILPKIWRTRLLGITLAMVVIYLIIDNFGTFLTLIHIRD